MQRRRFLAAAGATAASGLAGCLNALGFGRQSSSQEPPLVENRPDAVYVPTHVEGMNMFGMARDGPYRCALGYSFPHRFWLVQGRTTNQVHVRSKDSVHLMPVVWHEPTGTVAPASNPTVQFTHDGEPLQPVAPWPMLSQPMGAHFGDNVEFPANGTYGASVRVAFETPRTGALADAPAEASFDLEFTFLEEKLREIPYRNLERAGERGAVDPMEMGKMPTTQLPADRPGTKLGAPKSGDAVVEVRRLDDAARFGGGESDAYLAVSPQSPYNRYPLVLMALSARVRSGSETVFDDAVTATLDPDFGYHYGAVVPGGDWSEVRVTVDVPPQTARHEGYETAFLDMPAVTVRP